MFDGCLRFYLTTSGLSFLCFRVTYVLYLNKQLMQEAILALISFQIDEAVHLPYRQ